MIIGPIPGPSQSIPIPGATQYLIRNASLVLVMRYESYWRFVRRY